MRGWPVAAVLALAGATGCVREVPQRTAPELLAAPGFDWAADSTSWFRFHVERGSDAHSRLPVLMARFERDRRAVLDLLGEPRYPHRIDVFIVDSRADLRALFGRETNGVAHYRTNVIGIVSTPEWSAATAHEVLHVIAMNLWGVTEPWLNEGLAVYAAGTWHGADLHEAAAALFARGRGIPLRRLFANFRAQDETRAYPLAGSFVRYLHERFGDDALRAIWQRGAGGLEEITGADRRALERAWRAEIRKSAPDTPPNPSGQPSKLKGRPIQTFTALGMPDHLPAGCLNASLLRFPVIEFGTTLKV